MYQILSESVGFCRRDDKKHFGVFFVSQCILYQSTYYQQVLIIINERIKKMSHNVIHFSV